MRHFKPLAVSGLLLSSLALGGCNTAIETQILTDISNTCGAVGTGAQIAVTVLSSLNPAVAVLGETVEVGAGVCTALSNDVEQAISSINAAGGTATVNVSTATPTSARFGGKMVHHHYRLTFAPGSKTYIAPPGAMSFF